MDHPKTRYRLSRAACTLIGAAALLTLAGEADASVQWTVAFESPSRAVSVEQTIISQNILAAAADWSQHVIGGSGSIQVLVRISPTLATASGRSVTSTFLYNNGAYNVWQQGAASEIRSGSDPNGLTHDVEITLGQNFMTSSVWWDPDPWTRTTPVPSNLYDGYSVLLHEIGHALGFNGWRNAVNGAIAGFGSNYDELTTFDGSTFTFNGDHAIDVYGRPVPLTFGNIFHVGNLAGRPGADLIPDLMNGVFFSRGTRYDISRLDLAILADLGLPIAIPDVPAPITVLIPGLGSALAGARRRRA